MNGVTRSLCTFEDIRNQEHVSCDPRVSTDLRLCLIPSCWTLFSLNILSGFSFHLLFEAQCRSLIKDLAPTLLPQAQSELVQVTSVPVTGAPAPHVRV